jgi:hypothetical protein
VASLNFLGCVLNLLCTSSWHGFSCIDDLTIHICRSPACEQKCPWELRQHKSKKGIFPGKKNTFIKTKISQHGRPCKMFCFVHNKPQSTNGLIQKSSLGQDSRGAPYRCSGLYHLEAFQLRCLLLGVGLLGSILDTAHVLHDADNVGKLNTSKIANLLHD